MRYSQQMLFTVIAWISVFSIFPNHVQSLENTEIEGQITNMTRQIIGTVDIVAPKFIVINDSKYKLAPSSNISTSSFAQGQYVEAMINENRELISIKRITPSQQKVETSNTNNSSSEVHLKAVPLKQEKGIWKN